MELHIIRHKTARDYFNGFFPDDQVDIYTYQLQRMFESGAAKEGDYLLVKEDGIPFLNAEIYSTNSRKLWERIPVLSPSFSYDEQKFSQALKVIFEFIEDNGFAGYRTSAFEIAVPDNDIFSNLMTATALKYGYRKFSEKIEYSKVMNTGTTKQNELTEAFKPMTDFEPDVRFSVCAENDPFSKFFRETAPLNLYQDYLEEGYLSEGLWRMLIHKGHISGFIMPVFTSGHKNVIKLINYSFSTEIAGYNLYKDIIEYLTVIAIDNNIIRIEISAESKDIEFRKFIETQNFEKTGSYKRYGK